VYWIWVESGLVSLTLFCILISVFVEVITGLVDDAVRFAISHRAYHTGELIKPLNGGIPRTLEEGIDEGGVSPSSKRSLSK
jgi:hypothetical protein